VDVTITTVAKRAGVSVSTVSRVLNNPELVKAETRQRVLEAMRELNYAPNEIARGLVSGTKSDAIGLIVPELTNLFFNELYKGIDKAAARHGLHVLLLDSGRAGKRINDGFTFLRQRNVSGIIYSSSYITEEVDEFIARLDVPVALVLTDSASSRITAFKVDDVRATFDAVCYLATRGHRHIGMISGPLSDPVSGESRFRGYRMALNHLQLPFTEQHVAFGGFRYAHGYAAMQKLIEHRDETHITAVMAASDEMAIGAMRCIFDNGLRVPDDISVMGYDDVVIADMVTPKLTTVAQPFEQIARDAVEFLVDVRNGDHRRVNGGTRYLPHRIVERESVKSR
jgi:LacI family transcriptional regulator